MTAGILEGVAISVAASALSAGLTYALTPGQTLEAGRQNDLFPPNQGFGAPLPWCWGRVRVPGIRIGAAHKEETKLTKKQGGFLSKTEVTTYYYYGNFATAFCDCPFRPVESIDRLWFNKKVVYTGPESRIRFLVISQDKYDDRISGRLTNFLTFYYGNKNQPIDPSFNAMSLISSGQEIPLAINKRRAYLESIGIQTGGIPRVNANNRLCYYVATQLPLEDYFNRLPGEEAELTASIDCTVGQIFGDLFGLVYPDYEFDLGHISTSEFAVAGYTIDNIESAKKSIQELQKNHFIDLVRTGNGFKFIPLNSPRDVVNLRKEDLGAYSGGQKPFDFERIDPDPDTLPTGFTVSHKDSARNYDRISTPSTLILKGRGKSKTINISTNEIMSESKAQTLADRSLLMAWILATKYKFSLPPSYLDLEPTDLLPNLFDSSIYPIKLIQCRPGANMLIQCEGVLHDTTPLLINRDANSAVITFNIAKYNEAIEVYGNLKAVSDSAGNIYSEGTDYTINSSGNIEINPNGSIAENTELNLITEGESLPAEEDFGTFTNPGNTELLVLDIPLIDNEDPDFTLYLAAGGEPFWTGCSIYTSTDNSRYTYFTNFEDSSIYGNCITDVVTGKVQVTCNGELETVSNADLTAGFNTALIGDRIAQYKTAVLIDIDTYELSDITWGLRGTERESEPVSGDRFVLLIDPNSLIEYLIYEPSQIGQIKYIKALSDGQTLDEVDPIQHLIQGASQRPFAPVNLYATKNAVGDITIAWDRRDRRSDIENPPILSEDQEQFVCEILNENTIARSISTNNSSAIYTNQDQTADFGAIQTNISVKVAQVSSSVGIGSYSPVTELTPQLVEPKPTITSFAPPSQSPNYPYANPVTLPYTLQPTDDGSEIIVDGQTGVITIPDDVTDPNSIYFEPTWGCEITLENPGQIAIEKQDLAGTGNKTDGIKGNNTIVTDNKTIRLWHRGNNIWKLD